MNDKKIRFRGAIGGYNKEDVNEYIETLSTKHHAAELESNKKISELEEKVKELENELESRNESFLAENAELKERLEKAEALIDELNETLAKQGEEKEQLSKENTELKAKGDEYEKMCETNSELYEKSSKYDRVSEQIGSMIVSANARAESIVSEAELKAKVISNAMIEAVLEKLNAVNDRYANEIVTKTVKLTEELGALALNAEKFRNETRNAVESDCGEIKESLETSKRVIMEEN